MRSLNVLIVEDEILIAETISLFLKERNHNVTGKAISYEEAVQSYKLRKPDLVLLDIRLYGEKSGIDFANYLKSQTDSIPFIYLTSQYDQRVLEKALETHPYGYLTKPFRKESLWTSVETAYNLYLSKTLEEKAITIFDGKNNYSIKVSDVLYIQADHVYSKVVTLKNSEITLRKSLQEVFQLFDSPSLIYCHRSYIVNLKHISEWNMEELVINKSTKISISRSKRNELLDRLNVLKS